MSPRHYLGPVPLGFLSLLWAWMILCTAAALAQEAVQSPSAPMQPAQSSLDKKPEYTPEQQQRLNEAAKLANQATQLERQRKYADATTKAKQALAIREEILPSENLDVARSLNALASIYQAQGNYVDALPLFQRCLKIREKVLGPDHREVAIALNNLAYLYHDQGNFADALPLYQRAIKIGENKLGPDNPDLAVWLNALASLYQAQGNYVDALPLYQRSLKIREKVLGPDHQDVAIALNNLALLYFDQGNYDEAQPLFQRSLKIREKNLGPDHPSVAISLNNLANLYKAQENYTEALPLYQRSLEIREKTVGPDHRNVAVLLGNLATLYKVQGDYAEALPLYQRAIKIGENKLGPDHPDLAVWLNNLGVLYEAQGNHAEALPLFQRSLKIREKNFGPNHPSVDSTLHNLAILYDALGDDAEAEPIARRALSIMRERLERTAVIQSERQQLQTAQMVRSYLDNYLTAAYGAKVPAEEVYGEVLAWKGSVSARQQAMRQLRSQQHDPTVTAMYNRLADTARQLDSLSRAAPPPERAEQYRQKLVDLNGSLETLQQQLAAASAEYRNQLEQEKLTSTDLRQALPAETVLVDLLEYIHYQPPKEKSGKVRWEQRLVAFVVRPSQEIVRIELGPTKPIANLIDRWRKSYSAADGAELRRLVWEPLEDKIAGATTVLVSPDGALDRFPLAALPGKKEGTYLIEEVAIATIPIPRLLPEMLAASSSSNKDAKASSHPSLLTVGEVDFKAALMPQTATDQLAMRAPLRRDGDGWQFLPLDGTRAEIVAINDSFEQRFPDGQHQSLRKAQATKQAVCEAMPNYSYLHLATHGFFAPPELKSALTNSGTTTAKGAELNSDTRSSTLDVSGYHPDLLVGLALAGANQKAETGQDDGILTALAVEELDLSHVQLATLSACETGLGKTAGGEGVLGLQRAFQLAGAKSTVTTLWKIPDKASQLLMTDFYANLWDADKHLPKLEALRQAQLKMLREGAHRGLELDEQPDKSEGRMPPFYWAAFELSGDWR